MTRRSLFGMLAVVPAAVAAVFRGRKSNIYREYTARWQGMEIYDDGRIDELVEQAKSARPLQRVSFEIMKTEREKLRKWWRHKEDESIGKAFGLTQ